MFKKTLAAAAIVGFSVIALPAHASTTPSTPIANVVSSETASQLLPSRTSGPIGDYGYLTYDGKNTFVSFEGDATTKADGTVAYPDALTYVFPNGALVAQGGLWTYVDGNVAPVEALLPSRTSTPLDGYGYLTYDSHSRHNTLVEFNGDKTSKANGTVESPDVVSQLGGSLVVVDGFWKFVKSSDLPSTPASVSAEATNSIKAPKAPALAKGSAIAPKVTKAVVSASKVVADKPLATSMKVSKKGTESVTATPAKKVRTATTSKRAVEKPEVTTLIMPSKDALKVSKSKGVKSVTSVKKAVTTPVEKTVAKKATFKKLKAAVQKSSGAIAPTASIDGVAVDNTVLASPVEKVAVGNVPSERASIGNVPNAETAPVVAPAADATGVTISTGVYGGILAGIGFVLGALVAMLFRSRNKVARSKGAASGIGMAVATGGVGAAGLAGSASGVTASMSTKEALGKGVDIGVVAAKDATPEV